MFRYENAKMFGLGMRKEGEPKEMPINLNSSGNPLPYTRISDDGKSRYRVEAALTPRDSFNHLWGQRSSFHVSSGTRAAGLYALDLDGESGTDWRTSAAYGIDLLHRILPNVVPFVEPGRSWPRKGGCYIWFRIRWSGLLPAERHLMELRLGRLLKALAPEPPAGVKFDRFVGRTSYFSDNPDFDRSYADSLSYDGCTLYWLIKNPRDPNGCWSSKRDVIDICMRMGATRDQAVAHLDQLLTRRSLLTQLDAYEKDKMFYGINGLVVDRNARFKMDYRLERRMRHFGLLVTRPCYAAFRGDRPNNLEEFLAWVDNAEGAVTLAKLKKAIAAYTVAQMPAVPTSGELAPSDHSEAELHMAALELQAQLDDELSISLDPTLHRPDSQIVKDPLEGAQERLSAMVRTQLRRHNGNVDAAVMDAVAWYEGPNGPATGQSEQEHARRVVRATQIASYWLDTFDPELCKGEWRCTPEVLPFSLLDIQDMEAKLGTIISPQDILRVHKGKASPPNLRVVATICCLMLTNIHTGNFQEVPMTSLSQGLKSFKMGRNNRVIATAKWVLEAAGLIQYVRGYSTTSHESQRWDLGPRAIVPAWAQPLVQRARAHTATGVAA